MADRGAELLKVLQQAGFKGEALRTAWAIAMRESGGRARAFNGNRKTGDESYGLFQINMLGRMGPARLRQLGLSSKQDLFDPLTNARAAYKLSKGGKDFGAWGQGPNSYLKPGSKNYVKVNQMFQNNLGKYDAMIRRMGGVPAATQAQPTVPGKPGTPPPLPGSPPLKPGETPKRDTLDPKALAESYNFAYALIKGEPELASLFKRATAEGWDSRRFNAELKTTKWYMSHEESWRMAAALKATSPGDYNAALTEAEERVKLLANQMGAVVPPAELKNLAWKYVWYGWKQNEAKAARTLSSYIAPYKQGGYGGEAGVSEDALRNLARANGVTMSGDFYAKAVKSIADGSRKLEDWTSYIREQAASLYPVYADKIKSGMNVQDLASGYMNLLANTLEVDAAGITLDDPYIKMALRGVDEKGNPRAMGLWDFEKQLKKDPRWGYTKQAKNEADNAAINILRDFGYVG